MKKLLSIFIVLSTIHSAYSQSTAPCGHLTCQHMKQMLRGGSALTDPGNLRSDTLDIINYNITLDMTMMDSQQISASCDVNFKSKMDFVDEINLDLLALTVDSVTHVGGQLLFSHIGELLHVQLPEVLNIDDEYSITVHYHGSPESDALWGGFYFSSGYAYNLGVGFVANPHNFGRVWFPCFDNFVERSAFEVSVLTNDNRTAYCGGMRTSVTSVGQDSLLTYWQLNEEIPSYLASVAVTNYTHAENSFESISGDQIPIYLAAKAADTTEFKQSFINLVPWLEAAESYYGPYRWPRVGFTAVPFNGGAMEHATNIAYPLFAIDGSLAYEELYAHELSHHWWGDLVTCRNAYDMWLNEGWASYSEALFQEVIYGQEAYIQNVRENHKDVLLNAHQDDGARYPVSPVPHELTYGSHVYNKGADVVHTLRKMMGSDEAFWNAIRDFMEQNAYSDVSTEDLQDHFQLYTSNDLSSYFAHAIHEPGFAEFRVSDFSVEGNECLVTTEQHSHYAPSLYGNVLMNITALNASGELHTWWNNTLSADEEMTLPLTLPAGFAPIAIFLNADDGINMAVLAEQRWLLETGNNDFDFAEMDLDLDNLGGADSIFVRIENHFAAVDENQSQVEYFISPDRWWNVITNATEDALLSAEIKFYGNEGQSNYFDSLFFSFVELNDLNEDSLVLLYRPSGASLWQPFSNYELSTMGSNTNWTGRFTINNLLGGQYAWAVRTGVVSVQENENASIQIFAANDEIVIQTFHLKGTVQVHDAAGKLIVSESFFESNTIDTTKWSRGIYSIQLAADSGEVYKRQLMVR